MTCFSNVEMFLFSVTKWFVAICLFSNIWLSRLFHFICVADIGYSITNNVCKAPFKKFLCWNVRRLKNRRSKGCWRCSVSQSYKPKGKKNQEGENRSLFSYLIRMRCTAMYKIQERIKIEQQNNKKNSQKYSISI